MNLMANMRRESTLMLRDRAVIAWAGVIFLLAVYAVWVGMAEVKQQRESITWLLQQDKLERDAALTHQSDYGGVAYYSFHLTYDEPSNLAFAAMGLRDETAWKHRVRMLALEGQIYERDAGNPVFALIGRLDFAFLMAVVWPLALIMLLHDLKSSERVAGRYNLLVATAAQQSALWVSRALLRAGLLLVVAVLPFVTGALLSGASLLAIVLVLAMVIIYAVFWLLVCYWLASWQQPSPTILAANLGVWLLLAVVIPLAGRITIDQIVPLPSGSEILMTQREAVNDAWDLPKQDTFDAFVATHPQWQEQAKVGQGFQWDWYYAFQQVGDQKTQALSDAYRDGRLHRDSLAGLVAWVAPPALLERSMQRIAQTDLKSVITYESKIREFHAQLRQFYYPLLFGDGAFDADNLQQRPNFSLTHSNDS